MHEQIPTNEIIFSARYPHRDLSHQIPDDIVESYLEWIPQEHQELNRKKAHSDLQLAAAQWGHWNLSCDRATRLGYTVDEDNRVGGLYAVALVDKIKAENDYQKVIDFASKYGFTEHDYDIESINSWKRIDDNTVFALAGDYKGRPGAPGSGGTTFWASVGVLWAPRHLVEKYQEYSDKMPMHLI